MQQDMRCLVEAKMPIPVLVILIIIGNYIWGWIIMLKEKWDEIDWLFQLSTQEDSPENSLKIKKAIQDFLEPPVVKAAIRFGLLGIIVITCLAIWDAATQRFKNFWNNNIKTTIDSSIELIRRLRKVKNGHGIKNDLELDEIEEDEFSDRGQSDRSYPAHRY